tara:strand:- start:231 stop:620 length:390 start_codon:yes stop_codon:yes gene_type:complete
VIKQYDDPHYIVKLEKAIAEKYGHEAIQNPKKGWNEEKEKEYIEQQKRYYERLQSLEEKSEKVEVDGIFISKKLLNKKSNRTCPTCGSYSFKLGDDVYMNKYGCCYECFFKYVEGREERWKSGWRPKGE